jgi:type VI secretion system protein ImpA
MSAQWNGQGLLEPISAEQPCGQNLEDSAVLAAFDARRVFGQATPLDAPAEPDDQDDSGEKREKEPVRAPIDWTRVQEEALEVLARSKDLRVLAQLGAALLRTEGLPAFTRVLTTASEWIEKYWPQVYPLVDEDAIVRKSALDCLADPMAVVDRVWRLPLVASQKHGRFSLRDIDLASGAAPLGPKDTKPDEAAIRAAFAEMSTEALTALDASVKSGTAALNSIDAKMRGEGGGSDFAPSFGPLLTQFARLARYAQERLAERTGGSVGETVAADGNGSPVSSTYTGGAIKSRQDAVRALDAVAEFFRRNEPSSPIPLFVDRAKRLVSKDFLEVLEDIAPDALAVARSAGGLKPDQ